MGDVFREANDSIRPRSAPEWGAMSTRRHSAAYRMWDPDVFDDRTLHSHSSAPRLPRKRLAILALTEKLEPLSFVRSRSERIAISLPAIPSVIRAERIFRPGLPIVGLSMASICLVSVATIK